MPQECGGRRRTKALRCARPPPSPARAVEIVGRLSLQLSCVEPAEAPAALALVKPLCMSSTAVCDKRDCLNEAPRRGRGQQMFRQAQHDKESGPEGDAEACASREEKRN